MITPDQVKLTRRYGDLSARPPAPSFYAWMTNNIIDQMIEKLRRAEVPDDQIDLALKTSETLLGLMREIATAEDAGENTSIRDVIAGMAGEPPR